jgi:hypothetical protein
MRRILMLALVIIVILVGTGLGAWAISRKQKGQDQKPPADVYITLRSKILNLKHEEIAAAPSVPPGGLWGVVMDWGVANGSATVLALSDGSASIYFSGGGGHIGGGGVPAIRNEAIAAVARGSELRSSMKPATEFPLPGNGEVIFYALTDDGRFTTRGTQDELQSRTNPA